jgi:hypothetical protein
LGLKAGHLKPFVKLPENVGDSEELDAYFFNQGELNLDIQEDKIELSLQREFKLSTFNMLSEWQGCRKNIIGGNFHFTASFEGDLEDN